MTDQRLASSWLKRADVQLLGSHFKHFRGHHFGEVSTIRLETQAGGYPCSASSSSILWRMSRSPFVVSESNSPSQRYRTRPFLSIK
jgi:hypothetical protein